MSNWYPQSVRSLGILLGVWGTFWLSGATAAPPHFAEVAKQVDQAIEAELQAASLPPAGLIRDEDYLRRVTFDLTGRIPTPAAMTEFGLNPDPLKRSQKVEALLEDEDFAYNWSAYWRDVIFMRATEQRARAFQGAFQIWMRDQLAENRPWNEITTELLTATGDVRENGATGLMFAHSGEATELAAEATRIFLGIQIQCANCHDHPTDKWKRNSFHELAAFFPRVRVRPVRDAMPRTFEVVSMNQGNQFEQRMKMLQDPTMLFRTFDRNRDGKLTEQEVRQTRMARGFEQLISRA
ncbi:MAG: DUF1549 domain-containing protein, partial [Planctomycetaceae bacterium]|nr:DUF1549 domain-containing protein [Planctomycetaceae bacterium]